MYTLLKTIHLTTVFLSLGLFITRLIWRHTKPSRLSVGWVRIAPHVIDTFLLASAIGLTLTVHQYPFVDPWLTAKVIALFAYIVCGSFALKRAQTPSGRLLASALALGCAAYIVAVAVTHDPSLGWPGF